MIAHPAGGPCPSCPDGLLMLAANYDNAGKLLASKSVICSNRPQCMFAAPAEGWPR